MTLQTPLISRDTFKLFCFVEEEHPQNKKDIENINKIYFE